MPLRRPPDPAERPYLSPSEWWVMYMIWKRGATNVYEVLEAIRQRDPNRAPAVATVHTYLNRLVDKGYLSAIREGKTTLLSFYPTVAYEESLQRELLRIFEDYIVGDPDSLEVLDRTLQLLPVLLEESR